MLKALNMVEIRVQDFQAQVGWYSEKLGLQVQTPHEPNYCLLTFPDGGARLALNGTSSVELHSWNRCLPVILVDDLEGTVAELRSRGIEIPGPIHSGAEGYKAVAFNDPEGNRIQLYQWTSAPGGTGR